jgi:hypothetical protein
LNLTLRPTSPASDLNQRNQTSKNLPKRKRHPLARRAQAVFRRPWRIIQ